MKHIYPKKTTIEFLLTELKSSEEEVERLEEDLFNARRNIYLVIGLACLIIVPLLTIIAVMATKIPSPT